MFPGGVIGLRLSPDTARFVADVLSDPSGFELIDIVVGALAGFRGRAYVPEQFFLVTLGFAALTSPGS